MIKIDIDNKDKEENHIRENNDILILKNNKEKNENLNEDINKIKTNEDNPKKSENKVKSNEEKQNSEKSNDLKKNKNDNSELRKLPKENNFNIENKNKEKNKESSIKETNQKEKIKEHFNLDDKNYIDTSNDLNNNLDILNKENKKEIDKNNSKIDNDKDENLSKVVDKKDENFVKEMGNNNEIKGQNKILIKENNNNNEKVIINEGITYEKNNMNYIKSLKTSSEEMKDSNKNEILDCLNKENNNLQKVENKDENNSLNKKLKFEGLEISSKNEFFCFAKKRKLKINRENHFEILPKEEEFDEDTKMDFLKKIKPKGLKNLGSCCYMNATLQCFYHIKELTYYFLDNKKFIKRKNGLILEGLLDLIEGLSKNGKSTYYSPNKFRDNLIELDNLFEGYEGKDSKDLVETILYNLQDELIGDSDFPDLGIDQRQERLKYLDFYYTNSKVRTIVTDLFNFDFRTTRSCYNCGVRYYSFSNEKRLIFNLESVYDSCCDGDNSLNNEKKVSLDECLSYFGIGNSYIENINCKFCHKKASILSFNSFVTLPEIFIFIMSRGHKETFECSVEFNEELDLQDLYININGITEERTTKFSLLGGTILYGSKGVGHTVAFCKHFDDNYYIFNDSSVYKTTFDEIRNSKIYLLFYQKNK